MAEAVSFNLFEGLCRRRPRQAHELVVRGDGYLDFHQSSAKKLKDFL
jgi:hypothetical protein